MFQRVYILLFLICFQQIVFGQSSQFYNPSISAVETSSGRLEGQVFSADNQPAAYVTILLKNTIKATITDEEGRFVLKNIKEGVYELEGSMTGLKTIQRTITIKEGETTSITLVLTEDIKKLTAVIVTAAKSMNAKTLTIGKVEIDPMDLPQSMTVVGQTVLRQQQALRLSDVIKNVTGVYLATTRGSTQESFSARGYAFSSSNLFKNGVRVNAGAIPEMSSLEKVEVLKGSAAILYGNVAPGGIVNMITKAPKFNFGGEVSLRAGSYQFYKPSFDVYGPIYKGIAYRLNGSFEKAASFRDVVTSERRYLNPSLLFKIGKQTELVVQGDYLQHQFTPDFGIGSLNNTTIANVPRSRFVGAVWSFAKTEQATAGATIKHQIGTDWKLNVTTAYQNFKRDYYSTERVQAAADGRWVRPLGRSDNTENYYLAQIDLTGKLKTGKLEHTLLIGVDADRYVTTLYSFNQPLTYDTINILDPARYQPRTDIPAAEKIKKVQTPIFRVGAYAQDLVSLSDKIKLLMGLRWSYQQAQAALTTNLLSKEEKRGTPKTDKAFSPRLGVVYRPLKTTSLFASYATSFSVNNGTDVKGNALAPSIIDQYEMGVKNDFLKGKISTNLTLYRIVNNNLAQTAPFAADGITPNNNTSLKELTGQTTSDGLEVDIASHPVSGLEVLAGYSYNYMRYTNTPDAKGNYIEGQRLVNTPAHTANASLFYTFQNKGLNGFKMGALAFYTGDRFGGWNNTIGQPQNYSRLIPVKGFTTIDISAGYTYQKFSLLAKVTNVTNTYNYYVHENYSINPIAPTQVAATLSYKF